MNDDLGGHGIHTSHGDCGAHDGRIGHVDDIRHLRTIEYGDR